MKMMDGRPRIRAAVSATSPRWSFTIWSAGTYSGRNLDGERIEGHMWNRLVSGIDVDLTREQFRRGEVIGEPTVAQRTPAIADPAHPRYHRYEAYLVLSDRVRASLGLVGRNHSGS
jgi:hypothetical protein